MIGKEEQRIVAYLSLKAELDAEFQQIYQQVNNLKLTIGANVKTEANQDGLLLQSEAEYMSCLELDRDKFEQLLQRDKVDWDQNLQSVKQKAQKMKADFMALMLQ